MKIKRIVSEKVLSASRENGKKGRGPTTDRGKNVVSQNATTHGVLAQKFPFKGDEEKAAYNRLISDLEKSIDRNDPIQRMLAEEVVIGHLRRGRALKLEMRLWQKQNPATELALESIKNSSLVDTGILLIDPESRWECTELTVAAKKQDERQLRNGPLTNNTGGGREIQLHAKFQDPMDKALRYQRATARDFYRASNLLVKLRGGEKSNLTD
jgi:hypothetical protein